MTKITFANHKYSSIFSLILQWKNETRRQQLLSLYRFMYPYKLTSQFASKIERNVQQYSTQLQSDYERQFERSTRILQSLERYLQTCQSTHVMPLLYESMLPLLLEPSQWTTISTLPFQDIRSFLFQCRRMILPACLPPEIICLCKHLFLDRWSTITTFYPDLLSFPVYNKDSKIYSMSHYFKEYLDTHSLHFYRMTANLDSQHVQEEWRTGLQDIYPYIYGYYYIKLLHPYCLDMTPIFESCIYSRQELERTSRLMLSSPLHVYKNVEEDRHEKIVYGA